MKNRKRIVRINRLIFVTRISIPVVAQIGRAITVAYVKAWRGVS